MEIEFGIVAYASKVWEEAVKLRENILRKPLGSKFSRKELEEEQNHIHVIGSLNSKIVATAVLVPEKERMKMQRVVVSESLRNDAIGSKMMVFCEEYSQSKGYDTVYCHARDSAVNFYLKNGYSKEGDYFDEDGIPHLKMRKSLSNAFRTVNR